MKYNVNATDYDFYHSLNIPGLQSLSIHGAAGTLCGQAKNLPVVK